MLTTLLLALLAVALEWRRRRRAFKERIAEIDSFMEWAAYEKIDRYPRTSLEQPGTAPDVGEPLQPVVRPIRRWTPP